MTDVEPRPPQEPKIPKGSRFGPFDLSRYITIVIAVVLGTMFLCLPVPRSPAQRINELTDPVRVVVHTFERDLELESAVSTGPAWLKRMLEIVMDAPESPLIAASDAYREVYSARIASHTADPNTAPNDEAQTIAGPPDPAVVPDPAVAPDPTAAPDHTVAPDPAVAPGLAVPPDPRDRTPPSPAQLAAKTALDELQIRRAVLLTEAGERDEADRALQLVDDDEPELSDLVRRAYGEPERAAGRSASDEATARLRPGWVRTRLELHLAERRGDTAAVEQMRSAESAKSNALRRRTEVMALLFCVPCVLGLVILCVWLLRNRPAITVGTIAVPPPWTWERGFAILVRSAFAGLVISTILFVVESTFELELVTVWTTLIASIPMMWWIIHYLVEPARLRFADAFGLSPSGRGVFGWVLLLLAVIALDQLGASVITVALRASGVESHWSEFAQENFVFGSTPFAALRFIDGAVWAPIFEEIGCRGLLYLTIRRRLGAGGAALISSALFGAVHLYSLPGLLGVCWSGLVYALAVERSRSLLPAMAAHAFNNAFALGSAWLFYR